MNLGRIWATLVIFLITYPKLRSAPNLEGLLNLLVSHRVQPQQINQVTRSLESELPWTSFGSFWAKLYPPEVCQAQTRMRSSTERKARDAADNEANPTNVSNPVTWRLTPICLLQIWGKWHNLDRRNQRQWRVRIGFELLKTATVALVSLCQILVCIQPRLARHEEYHGAREGVGRKRQKAGWETRSPRCVFKAAYLQVVPAPEHPESPWSRKVALHRRHGA